MSVISTFHKIEDFTPATSKPYSGQVLIVARGNKKSNTTSICASLPALSVPEIQDSEAIMPHLINYLDSVRAKMLRKEHTAGKQEVSTDDMSVAGIAAFLTSESEESGRLSKEMINEYLSSEENMAALQAAFAIALKYDGDTLTAEQLAKVNWMHNGFKDVISELSGTRTMWELKKQNTARKYLECLDDSPMKERLIAKLDDMAERGKKEDDVMNALGF